MNHFHEGEVYDAIRFIPASWDPYQVRKQDGFMGNEWADIISALRFFRHPESRDAMRFPYAWVVLKVQV